jgi:hypothetical protein
MFFFGFSLCIVFLPALLLTMCNLLYSDIYWHSALYFVNPVPATPYNNVVARSVYFYCIVSCISEACVL